MTTAKEYWKERFGEYPQSDADKLAIAMMAEYADKSVKNNLGKAAVKHQLIAYQKWCYEHPEYDQVTETPRVELYLKAINCA